MYLRLREKYLRVSRTPEAELSRRLRRSSESASKQSAVRVYTP